MTEYFIHIPVYFICIFQGKLTRKNVKEHSKSLFTLGCFFLASYMTNTQIMRFLENDDTSSIQFRRFNSAPKDTYPIFSICFAGAELNWYHDKSLFIRSGLSPSMYAKMLKGLEVFKYEYDSKSRLYDKASVEYKNTSEADGEKISLSVTDILTQLEYDTENLAARVQYHSGMMKSASAKKIPLYIGYRTPDTVCFSRASKDELDTVRVQDRLVFNQSVLGQKKYSDVRLKIFVHYPNQLLRSFHKPVFDSRIGSIAHRFWNPILTVKIPQATVVRKRASSNVPCDDHLVEDDRKLQAEIIDVLKCIPIYWKQNVGTKMPYKECNKATELQNAFYFIQNYKNVYATYDPPCVSMVDWSTVNSEEQNPLDDLRIEFLYMATEYKEITNMQSFGFESFVSGLGGFVGIFLGYSILQLPDLVGSVFSACTRFTKKHVAIRIRKEA